MGEPGIPAPSGVADDEFAALRVVPQREQRYREIYGSFGWVVDAAERGPGTVTLRLRRARVLRSRPIVDELQRRCEEALAAVDRLERSRRCAASAGWGVALLGGVFTAASVVAALVGGPSLVLGVGGVGVCALGVVVHVRMRPLWSARLTRDVAHQWALARDHGTRAARLLT